MINFCEAHEDTQRLILDDTEISAKRIRPTLGAGAGAVGELFSELLKTDRERLDMSADGPSMLTSSTAGVMPLWRGSAKIRLHEAMTIAQYKGAAIDDSSLVLSIGGPDTTITGNLEIFDEFLRFVPHRVWLDRGLEPLRLDPDRPAQYAGIMAGQSGPRALVVTMPRSTSVVIIRLGMFLKGLEDVINARLAPM